MNELKLAILEIKLSKIKTIPFWKKNIINNSLDKLNVYKKFKVTKTNSSITITAITEFIQIFYIFKYYFKLHQNSCDNFIDVIVICNYHIINLKI